MFKNKKDIHDWLEIMIYHPGWQDIKDELDLICQLDFRLHDHKKMAEDQIEKLVDEGDHESAEFLEHHLDELVKEADNNCVWDKELRQKIQISIDYCNQILNKYDTTRKDQGKTS